MLESYFFSSWVIGNVCPVSQATSVREASHDAFPFQSLAFLELFDIADIGRRPAPVFPQWTQLARSTGRQWFVASAGPNAGRMVQPSYRLGNTVARYRGMEGYLEESSRV